VRDQARYIHPPRFPEKAAFFPHFDWSADKDTFDWSALDEMLAFDWSALDKMLPQLNDWSTLDAMFPAQDKIVDKLFQPIDKAMGKKRPRRVGTRRRGGKPRR
jgi:hypothetical protein